MTSFKKEHHGKPLFTWRDLLALPLMFVTVVAVEHVWNWIFEGEAYVEWDMAWRLTMIVFISIKVGEYYRARKTKG